MAFVDEICREFVIAIETDCEAWDENLVNANIEIMRPLHPDDAILLDSGDRRRIVEKRDRRRGDEFERRWHEITGIAGMDCGGLGCLHDQIHTRAHLILIGELIHRVEAHTGVEGQSGQKPPFILQVSTIKTAGAGAIVDDTERHIRGLRARCVDRQHERRCVKGYGLNLPQEAAAQCVAFVDPPACIGLYALREIGSLRERGHPVEQEVADHVRTKGQNTVADKGRELHIDIIDMLLQ